MYIKNIRLHEAMTKDIAGRFRIWILQGLHVEEKDIPKNASVAQTFVMKLSPKRIQVGIEWTINGVLGSFTNNIAEFSSLEELQSTFPHLFELDGVLCAFS